MATWYETFNRSMNIVFTKKDFAAYKKMVHSDLEIYQKYLGKGAKILDLGCGLGCTAIPLSTFGYNVTGIDNDSRVVAAARKNARNFGKSVKILEGDVFEIDKIFGRKSFDACISGGLLEHFNKSEIRKLVKLQLRVAPLIIASMPVKTERTKKHYWFDDKTALGCTSPDGICRNFWSEKEWINDVLKEFNAGEHFVKKVGSAIGGFDEVFVVIKR